MLPILLLVQVGVERGQKKAKEQDTGNHSHGQGITVHHQIDETSSNKTATRSSCCFSLSSGSSASIGYQVQTNVMPKGAGSTVSH
jgi:hypothetical protein